MENWKQIKDFPDYEVSDHGRVRSNLFRKTKIMKQRKGGHGYLYLALWKEGIRHTKLVHRLVLETFVCECPVGMECSHQDYNKENNRLDNLAWETYAENTQKREWNKLSKLKVSWIRLLLERGWSGDRLAKEFGVCGSTISHIKKFRIWKDV